MISPKSSATTVTKRDITPPSVLRGQKLVSVSLTSTLVTRTRKETVETAEAIETAKIAKDGEESKGEYPNLAQVLCIRYPITFQKKFMSVLALFNLGSEVNAIYLTLIQELGLSIRPTDVGAQKIDGTMLDTFGIVVTAFSMTDKANRVRFFKKIFLVTNISSEIVLGMPFLTLSNVNVDFSGRKLW